MRCPSCGRESREGTRFCPGCGASLEAAAGEGAGAAGTPAAAGKGRWLWAVVAMCALLLAGAAFAVVYLAVLRSDDEAAPGKTEAVSEEEKGKEAEKGSAEEEAADAARREERGPFGKMAFIREGDVWIYDLESGEETRLTEDGTCAAPDLRPDGKKVAYTSEKGADADPYGYPVYTQIYEVDVASRETRKVTDLPDWRCYDPAYSPDGGEIAFGRFGKPRSGTEDYPVRDAELCLLDLESGELTTVARGESGPEWVPFLRPAFCEGGRSIAYLNAYEGGGDAEIVPRSGGTAKPITLEGYESAQETIEGAVFSRDGKKMAVTFLWEPEGVFIKDLASGKVSEARGLSDLGFPCCFSPGGRYLAFQSLDGESVWIAEIEGSYREMITRGNQADWEP